MRLKKGKFLSSDAARRVAAGMSGASERGMAVVMVVVVGGFGWKNANKEDEIL